MIKFYHTCDEEEAALGHHGACFLWENVPRKDLFKEINGRGLTSNNTMLMDLHINLSQVFDYIVSMCNSILFFYNDLVLKQHV